MEEKAKCRKRPDLEYYKPPKMISKMMEKEGDSDHSVQSIVVNKTESIGSLENESIFSLESDGQSKVRCGNKKPDKQVYIAGPKSSFSKSRETKEEEGREEKVEQETSKECINFAKSNEKIESKEREDKASKKSFDSKNGTKNEIISEMVIKNSRFHKNSKSKYLKSNSSLPKERSKNLDAKSEEAQKFDLNKSITPPEVTTPYLSNPPSFSSLPQPQSSPKPPASASIENDNDNVDNLDKESQSSSKSSNLKQLLSKVEKSANIREPNVDQGKVGKYFNRPHVQHSNDRGRSKKFSNRSEHKYEQNLPPRLQKKLLRDKANQNQAARQPPAMSLRRFDPNFNSHIDVNPLNRGGIIKLPPDAVANIEKISSNSANHLSNLNSMDSNRHSHSPRPYGIHPQGQFLDAYHPNKPCVVIRPTSHIPYQPGHHLASHHNTRPPLATHLAHTSQSPDIMNLTNWSSHYRQSPTDSRVPLSPPNLYYHYYNTLQSSPQLTHSNIPIQPPPLISNTFDSSNLIKKRLKPLVEKNMNEVLSLEKELQSYLVRSNLDDRNIDTIRWKIQHRYENIILADLKFCAENNVELILWKSAFYQFIEIYRRKIEDNQDIEQSKDRLIELVEKASLFFENLLVKIQDTFDFSVDKYAEHGYDSDHPGYEVIKLAALCAQKLYLYLGDLARYKEQATNTSNYGKARSYYLKAQQFAPKNGRPYNQLALLAIYGRRKLDAVYNYMRSLAASNPFLSARESLLSIFDEIRRKYENAESKQLNEKLGALKLSESNSQEENALGNNIFSERLEIWIRPDGTSSKHTSVMDNESAEEELDLLTDLDLNKRFVLSFLHVHGKLFTKIGMETFSSTVNQMLLEFRCLLKRSPFPISSLRLLQLLSISMFSVYYTSLKHNDPSPTYRSSLQEQAIQVTLAMVSLLLEKADESLKDYLLTKTNHQNIISDDVSELLPAIKIWTDWMSCHKQYWSPPLPSVFRTGTEGDIWSLFGEFLTTLSDVNTRSVKLLPTKFEGCEQIILPEDGMLSGFIPLLGAPHSLSFIQPPFDKEKARSCLRISRIQFFGDYLCGIPEPYLEFDVGKKRFNSLVPSYLPELSEPSHNLNFDVTSDTEVEDILTDSSSVENINNLEEDKNPKDKEIKELWSRQEALEKAQKREEKIRNQLDAVLREEKRTRLVIQPRFLLPDTNCFIHHLSKLQTIIKSGYFEIIVPLIAINELMGLMSRTQNPSSSIATTGRDTNETEDHEHYKRVGQAAKEAYEYLEKTFAEKNKLKAITSQGSILDNMNFTNESVKTKRTTNDDIVLSCCLQFIKKRTLGKQTNSQETGGVITIFRETVLLTDDRNLRVKALSHNVPVKSLPVFLQFANLQ